MELDISHATLEKLLTQTSLKQRYVIGVPLEREIDEHRTVGVVIYEAFSKSTVIV